MSSITTCEKLVKYTIKSISKKYNLEYEELKANLKKVVKTAKNYDEMLLGMMEEMMDLGNVGSPEELEDFNIEVLKVYCKIKDIDPEGSDRHIRSRVWKNIESEFELDDEDSEEESEEESEESEPEPEEEEIKELPKEIISHEKKKRSKREKEV
jgi:hypothetical protein